MNFRLRAQLWMHDGAGAWHFVTLPAEVADEIRDTVEPSTRGFGSIRVSVTIGGSVWQTSIFPSAASGSYDLPVKKPVRIAEGLEAGQDVEVALQLLQG